MVSAAGLPPHHATNSPGSLPGAATLWSMSRAGSATSLPLEKNTLLPSECHHRTRTPIPDRMASSISFLISLSGFAAAFIRAWKLNRNG